jgi:hypothetical protein
VSAARASGRLVRCVLAWVRVWVWVRVASRVEEVVGERAGWLQICGGWGSAGSSGCEVVTSCTSGRWPEIEGVVANEKDLQIVLKQ